MTLTVFGINRGNVLGKIAKAKMDRGDDPEEVLQDMLKEADKVGIAPDSVDRDTGSLRSADNEPST